MESNFSIGFVILTWNSNQYIERCIDSIFLLPVNDVYVSVFDNGSTDGTLDTLAKYHGNNHFFISTSNKNIGTTKSRNTAFRNLPSVDYICVIDSDTEIIDKDGFISMVNYLKDNNIGVIGPKLINSNLVQPSARPIPNIKDKFRQFSLNKNTKKRIEEKNDLLRYLDNKNDVIYAGYLMSACFVIRYDLFNKVGGFDEKIFYAPEDVDFCVRVWEQKLPVCLYKNCKVFHYWQRISRKKLISKHNFEHIKGLLYIKRKFSKTLIRYIDNTCNTYNGTETK